MKNDGSSYIQDFNNQRMDGLEFCRKVYLAYEKCVADPELQPVGKAHKKLFEELMPLCVYIQVHYKFAHYLDVEWHKGNQPFDAIIYQRGWIARNEKLDEKYLIELTTAQHENQHLADELSLAGKAHHGPKSISRPEENRKANRDRIISSEAKCFDTEIMLSNTCCLIMKAINEKLKKNYEQPIVLVVNVRPPSMILWDREWCEIVTRVSNAITHQKSICIKNRFSSIFLCNPNKNLISCVHYLSNSETIEVD